MYGACPWCGEMAKMVWMAKIVLVTLVNRLAIPK